MDVHLSTERKQKKKHIWVESCIKTSINTVLCEHGANLKIVSMCIEILTNAAEYMKSSHRHCTHWNLANASLWKSNDSTYSYIIHIHMYPHQIFSVRS